VGVSRSLDEFAVKLQKFTVGMERGQIDAAKASRLRVEAAIKRAASQLAGPDMKLSRVGAAAGPGKRKGSRLGFTAESSDLWTTEFRARGAWQIRDSTISGGDTDAHIITPRPDRNKRPLSPATKNIPTMLTRDGDFVRGYIAHGGSTRINAWHRQMESVAPVVTKLKFQAFRDSLTKVF
jgi:hypothetical protein